MNRFYRSSDEKMIAGVCGGLAHYFDLNAIGMRWVLVLVSFFLTGFPVLVYAVLWMILKSRPTAGVTDV
jgi:phage shock protein PspC (stress-responsive transcriptional regulator)